MLCSIQSCPFGRHSMSCSRRDPGGRPGSDGGAQADRTRTAEVRGRTHGGRGAGRNRRPMTSEAGSGMSPAAGTAEGRPGAGPRTGRMRPWPPVAGGCAHPTGWGHGPLSHAAGRRLRGAGGHGPGRSGTGRQARQHGERARAGWAGARGRASAGRSGGFGRRALAPDAPEPGVRVRRGPGPGKARAGCGPGGRGEPDGTGRARGRGTGRARAGHRPFRRCPALAPP